MANMYFREAHPVVKLLFTGFVMVGSFLLFLILALILARPIFGMDLSAMLEAFSSGQDTRYTGLLKYLQIVQTVSLFIVPAIFCAWVFSSRPGDYLLLDKNPGLYTAFAAIVLMLVALPALNLLAAWNAGMDLPDALSGLEERMRKSEEAARELLERFLQARDIGGLSVNLLMIAILPAVGEELIFRGLFQRLFAEWFRSLHLGIIAAAFLFSFMHFQFYGFVPRLLMGIMFGYLLVWSGTVWLPVIAHFANNGAAVIYYYMYNRGEIGYDLDAFGADSSTIYWSAVSIAGTALLLYMICRKGKNR